MLGRYHLEHELGSGAGGAVFLGRENGTGRVVAIKLAAHSPADEHGKPARRPEGRSRQARTVNLAHPNIVAVHECAREGQLCCVIMARANGADLARHTRVGKLLALPTVLLATARVASALHHAHERGVVHGDVKPANIVFDASTAIVKLVDFPCRAVGAGQVGTPAYLSPERLCGMDASAASDQFALAVTLYQLACGHLPFSGRSRPELAYQAVHAPHTDLRMYDPELPAELASIFDTALAKSPAQRYGSARRLARAILDVHTRLRGGSRADAG